MFYMYSVEWCSVAKNEKKTALHNAQFPGGQIFKALQA